MKKLFALLLLVLVMAPVVVAYGVTFYNPSWNPQDGKIFDVVEADTLYAFEVRKDDIAIRKISFTINRDAQNAGVTVYHLKSVPSFLPEVPENDSYEVNEIKYSGFVPHDTTKFLYEFQVAKAFLEENKIPRNAIALHAYDKVLNTWTVLPTDVSRDDADFVYFNAADDEGVYYLFIGRAQSGETADLEMPVEEADEKETPAETATPVTDLGSEVTPVQLDTAPTPVVAPAPLQPTPAPVQPPALVEDEKSDSKMLGALVLIALIVIAVILYLVFGRKKLGYSVDKELNNYIDESLKRGKSTEEVRKRLLEVGWHHERVDKAMAKHNKKEIPKTIVKEEPRESHEDSMSLAEAKALAAKQKPDPKKLTPKKKPVSKAKKK